MLKPKLCIHARGALALLATALLFGCSNKNGSGSGSSGGGNQTYPDSTGNWVVQATATSKAAPFTELSGYINEQQTGSAHPTTGTFMVQSSGCYAGVENVPMQGVVQGLRLHLVSFGLDGQVLDISAAKDDTSTHFSGTYSVTGGCADGASGNVSGTRYDALNGTYSGAISGSSPQQTITLNLQQYTLGTGNGRFLISGSAALSGFSCFSSANLAADDGSVSGNQVTMHFTASQGGTMDIAGDFDQAASSINVTSIVISGSGCPVNPGPVTLSKA